MPDPEQQKPINLESNYHIDNCGNNRESDYGKQTFSKFTWNHPVICSEKISKEVKISPK